MSLGPPPPVCKISYVKPKTSGSEQQTDCITVENPHIYVVLSNNPESMVNATVRWPVGNPTHTVAVTSLGGDNLVLAGETTATVGPDQVEILFPNTDTETHSCNTTECAPQNCD